MNIRKIVVTLFSATLAFPVSVGIAKADNVQMEQLVSDVQYKRKTSRTYVFSRAQLKYGLERDDYLNRWIDQPLFVDPTLRGSNTKRESIYYPNFKRIQQVVKQYGLDGLGFFPQTSGRAKAYETAQRSELRDFHLLTEFLPSVNNTNPSQSDVVKMALDNPTSLRINGKVVVVAYRADMGDTLKNWGQEVDLLKKQYGNTFIFLPSILRWDGHNFRYWMEKYHSNSITKQDITGIKEYLRKWAKISDGLYFDYPAYLKTLDRKFDADFYSNFVIRLMKSVLAESQFNEKYFGLSAMVGHQHTTRIGYMFSEDGTKTLRHSLSAALDAQPDIIEIPEWDEQNENTSLRPTAYNGTSSMRILRYYTAKQRGEKLSPLPKDDISVPNLIISYRKLLTLGEKLEIELLNVPDSDKSTSYTTRLSLENLQGKVVYTSPIQQFNNDQMQDHTIVIPSETLAADEVLCPKLEIESGGRKSTFEDGLHYIELRPTWNWDYKWVKQSLRDLLKPTKVDFKIGALTADGKRMVTADFAADEPLAYVEVLDNDNIVYIAPPKKDPIGDKWRENEDQVIISISWQSLHSTPKALTLQGDITLKNAAAKWLLPGKATTTARNPFTTHHLTPTLQGQRLLLEGVKSSKWQGRIFLAIPRKEIDRAVLDMNMPGIFEGTIPVRHIINHSIYGIPGPNGFNMVISRYLRQDKMPFNLNTTSTQFEIPILPDLPNSVLHLQAISKSGRIYRSKPVLANTPFGKDEKVLVYSETQKHPIPLEVAASRVPDISYKFDPRHGSVLTTDAGRPFWGILGGLFTQATERGGGETIDGSPFLRPSYYPAGVTKGAPDWVKSENGEYALQFDGKGTYITLPQGVIPRRAGFIISMDIKPDTVESKQFIIGNRTYYMGSLVIYIDEGELKADFMGEFSGPHNSWDPIDTTVSSGLQLPANKWSHLIISYDQKNLIINVNGIASQPIALEGPGVLDTLSVVGGFGKDWFKGQIKNLNIKHTPS